MKKIDFSHNKYNKYFLYLFVTVALVSTIIRIIDLQIVKGSELRHSSNESSLRYRPLYAPRGVVFDRNGKQLVYNKASFSVWVDPNAVDDNEEEVIHFISRVVGVDSGTLSQRYKEKVSEGYSEFVLISDLDWEKGPYQISLKGDELPGVRIEASSSREYPEGSVYGQIIGYTGIAIKSDVSRGIDQNDTVGKDGLEAWYDAELRGTNGRWVIEVNRSGKIINSFVALEHKVGGNIYLTIDDSIQRKVLQVLSEAVDKSRATGGAAIIEDVKSGAILAMASLPNYDNNVFVSGANYEEINRVINDKSSPLINRAISSAYPPGSTFKTVTGSACLQTGAVTADQGIYTGGVFEYGGIPFQDFGQRNWGTLDMVNAYKVSSNIYFMKCALAIDSKTGNGIGEISRFARYYGLGEKTGIDLPGETAGLVASPDVKMAYHNEIWYPGDLLNASIGQGDNLVSPIQMVTLATAIANDGAVLKPHLVWKVEKEGKVEIIGKEVVRSGFISKENIDIVKRGMRASVTQEYGVARAINSSVVSIAAKTGTAEFGVKNKDGYSSVHAWVMGFAPYENPEIAFVLFLEGGGASWEAAKWMKNIVEWYFMKY